jgi:hypothetical protein
MKIKLTFKTPDVVEDAMNAYSIELRKANITPKKFEDICDKFIEYGEYVTIVIDTDTQTASVEPVRRT